MTRLQLQGPQIAAAGAGPVSLKLSQVAEVEVRFRRGGVELLGAPIGQFRLGEGAAFLERVAELDPDVDEARIEGERLPIADRRRRPGPVVAGAVALGQMAAHDAGHRHAGRTSQLERREQGRAFAHEACSRTPARISQPMA